MIFAAFFYFNLVRTACVRVASSFPFCSEAMFPFRYRVTELLARNQVSKLSSKRSFKDAR
jgi:hypothetical protein